MINNEANLNKKIELGQLIHGVPAGVHPNDTSIEFWGDRNSRNVFYNQNGRTLPFDKLPIEIINEISKGYLSDPMAVLDIATDSKTLIKQLEEYSFCLYGASDSTADFTNGKLSKSENFKCKPCLKCHCLKWRTKSISINNQKLTFREIQILEQIGKGYADKFISHTLNISPSTLDTHKANLYRKAGVQSKTQLIILAVKEKAIQ